MPAQGENNHPLSSHTLHNGPAISPSDNPLDRYSRRHLLFAEGFDTLDDMGELLVEVERGGSGFFWIPIRERHSGSD